MEEVGKKEVTTVEGTPSGDNSISRLKLLALVGEDSSRNLTSNKTFLDQLIVKYFLEIQLYLRSQTEGASKLQKTNIVGNGSVVEVFVKNDTTDITFLLEFMC